MTQFFSLALGILCLLPSPATGQAPGGAAARQDAALGTVHALLSTRAMQEFQEALELDPNFAPVYLNMGDNHLALDELPR